MGRNKVTTTVYLTPEQMELLQRLSERTKVPVAVYVREGLDLMLAKYVEHLPAAPVPLDEE